MALAEVQGLLFSLWILKFQRIAFTLLSHPIHLPLIRPIRVHTHSIPLVVARDPVPVSGASRSPSCGEELNQGNAYVPESSCYLGPPVIPRPSLKVLPAHRRPVVSSTLRRLRLLSGKLMPPSFCKP